MARAKNRVNRRGFLKGAVAGAAAGAASLVLSPAVPVSAESAASASAAAAEPLPLTPEEAARAVAAADGDPTPSAEVMTVDNPGSDFMVDVFKTLDFEYAAANPASSFRGLHESFINYGGNKSPEWITCCHEEVAVNIANGYYAV